MEEEVPLLDENDALPEGAIELPPEDTVVQKVNEEGLPIDDEGNIIDQTVPAELTVNQLAQAMQGSLTQVVQSFDIALRAIHTDIDEIKRFEGKQEGKLEGKIEEFDKRIANAKLRLGKVEDLVKRHKHK